jgi:hypothetical protein
MPLDKFLQLHLLHLHTIDHMQMQVNSDRLAA